MKKFISALLILSIVLSFVSCKTDDDEKTFIEMSVEVTEHKITEEFSTVISIKKEDIIKYDGFKTSDVLLSGSFSGLEVTEIENLSDRVKVSIRGNLFIDHVYYEDHLNDHLTGYIGLNYEKNNTVYYAGILLTTSELSVSPNAVVTNDQGVYDFEINLENAVFAKEITTDDIELRGSFQNLKIDKLVKLSNNTLSVKLSGVLNSYSSGIIHFFEGFDQSGVSSDALVKIIPDAILYTSGILFPEHGFVEDIVIRLKYHEFSESIGINNITLGGGLGKAVVSDITYMEPRAVRLTLTGPLDANSGTGTVTVSGSATNCGQAVSATLPIRDNIMFYEPKGLASSLGDEIKTYSMTITSLADYPSEVKAADITLTGVFQNMAVIKANLIDSKRLSLEIRGNCESGNGTVSIGSKSMYDIEIYVDHHELHSALSSSKMNSQVSLLAHSGSVSVSNNFVPYSTRLSNLSATESVFDFKKILGSAASGLAGFAGSVTASYILDATGIYKGTDAVLAEINQRIKDLQDSLDKSTLKITKDIDECNIKVQTAVIKDYISSYETYKNKYLSMTETTGKTYMDELANKMEALDFMKVLIHINKLLTDETDGTRNLIHTYNDYLAKVFQFQHQIDQPLKEIVQYYALIQTDMLYYYGAYCNYKYSLTGDASYLNDFQTAVDTVTSNIATQMGFVPNNPLLIETIEDRNLYYPITNNDGKYWCVWDPVDSSDWFQDDTHIDEPSLIQLLSRHYWHYTWTCYLIGKGFRVPTTDDISHIRTDFFKNTTLNTGTFLFNNGIELSRGYHKIYIETCDYVFADYYYFLDSGNMVDDYHKMGSASKLTDIWLVIYLAR
ncbi:MAG: hypothetical protein SCM11_01255 [Bacillota bacterium]|nr:hypothetical protein [Bacillota bacterium]